MSGLRVGMVGLGGVASAHLQAFDLLPELKLASVCDIRPEIAQTVAKQYQAQPFTDYRELLAAGGIDLLLVLTPTSTHHDIVIEAASAGLAVFCEKPLSTNVTDGRAMVRACDSAGVKFFYGSCYRYLPAVKKAYDLIQAGSIGDIQLMTEQVIGGQGLDRYQPLSPIHYPPGGPGGPGMGIVDHGIHLIDIFSWFTQSEIIQVQGRGQMSGAPAVSEYMAMEFANGATGHLLYNAATYTTALPAEGMFSAGQSWRSDSSIGDSGSWEPEPGSISVYGTQGALRIFHYCNALYLNTGAGLKQISLEGRPAFGHFATQLEDCIDALLSDREPTISGQDGLQILETMLRVYKVKK